MKSVKDVNARVTGTLVMEAEENHMAGAEKDVAKEEFPAMLSSKSPDHHVGSGVSGPPAVAVHAAVSEVIFKGISFNNVGRSGCCSGGLYSLLLVEKNPFVDQI